MIVKRKRRLEAAGFKVGTAREFLKMTPRENAMISRRLADARPARAFARG